MGHKIMRVKINLTKCEDTAECVGSYPEMFNRDPVTLLAVAKMKEGWDNARLLKAAQACPVKAIMVIGQDRELIYPPED